MIAAFPSRDPVPQPVGKAALDDHEKITLDVASLVEEDFLQQNGYSDYDQFCPLWKTEYMMKAFMRFHDESQRAISEGHNWANIKQLTGGISSALRNMKFEIPDDEDDVSVKYNDILRTMAERFVSISNQ